MQLDLASDSQVASTVQKLLTAGMAFPSDLDPQKAPAVYAFALNRVSKHVLADTVAKLIRGEMQGINPDFLPRPALLAQIVRKRMGELSMARQNALASLEAINDSIRSRRQPSPPHEIERVRQLNAEFQRQHREGKKKEDERLKIETDEQRDYWKRIQGLKDRRVVTEDNLRFREQVEQQLGDQ